jgi:F0F1-type ATP synthase membrane subunit b/b'
MQINLTPDLSLLAIMVIFLLNYVVVSRFFLRPINDVLEARAHESKTSQELYEQSMARFAEATAQMEEKLHLARREASAVRDHFRGEAAQYRASVVERTAEQALDMIAGADAKLTEDVRVARQHIVTESESLARMAAERILGRPV